MIKNLKVPDDSRLFFVSDLHGEIDSLDRALELLKFKVGKDVVVHAGDLVDRGTDSYRTAARFLTDTTGSFHSSRGNHDQFAIDGTNNVGIWHMNGGEWATKMFDYEQLQTFSEMMDVLPYVIEVDYKDKKIGVIHAEVSEEYTSWQDFKEKLPENKNKEVAIWSRKILYGATTNNFKEHLDGIDFTIHGHTVIDRPEVIGNRVYIDTGHVFGGYLTIAEFIGNEFVFYIYKDGKITVFEGY